MLLIIEIALIIAAWRKGWRWRALLPVAIAYGIAFLMGLAVGAGGGTFNNAAPFFLLIDIGLVIALIRLVVRAPKLAPAAQASMAITASGQTAGLLRG